LGALQNRVGRPYFPPWEAGFCPHWFPPMFFPCIWVTGTDLSGSTSILMTPPKGHNRDCPSCGARDFPMGKINSPRGRTMVGRDPGYSIGGPLVTTVVATVCPAHSLDTRSTSVHFSKDFVGIMAVRASAGDASLVKVGDEFWVVWVSEPNGLVAKSEQAQARRSSGYSGRLPARRIGAQPEMYPAPKCPESGGRRCGSTAVNHHAPASRRRDLRRQPLQRRPQLVATGHSRYE
jgi:hypothetical protein